MDYTLCNPAITRETQTLHRYTIKIYAKIFQ